jgi:hypothetical protein
MAGATATAATVQAHAIRPQAAQTRGEPKLASKKRPFQKRFDRKLYSVAVSQHVRPQSRRRENNSIASYRCRSKMCLVACSEKSVSRRS